MPDLSDYDRWLVTHLVHAGWYAATYPDSAGEEPHAHYRRIGASAGYDPNPLFSTQWYLARYPEVEQSGLNALEHYVGIGAAAWHDPGPLFNTRWYLARNPDVAAAGENPLAHYLAWGPKQRRDPSPVFDTAWYFSRYPDARGEDLDACKHFMQRGAAMGYAPCPLFDTAWYLRTYKAVAASGQNPLLHYLTVGAARGHDPGPQFSTKRYLASHPALMAERLNPLVHFLAAQRLPAGPPPSALADRLTAATIREAEAVVSQLRGSVTGLAGLPGRLDTIAMADVPPAVWASAWRGLYLSLTAIPRCLVLVGQIDATRGLAGLVDGCRDVLVVETDGAAVSVAECLPADVDWRSLSEFEAGLEPAGRVAVLRTMIAALRPESVTVLGSHAGTEMISLHGPALAMRTRLVVLAAAPPVETPV